MRPKTACDAATTADLASYVASGSKVGKTLTAPTNASSHNTIDDVLLAVNDRVLVKNQGGGASHADNGIYKVTALGNDTDTSFELTRAIDCDEDTEVTTGITTFIEAGTTNQKRFYSLVTPDDITVDTTAQEWSIFGGPGQSHDSLTDVSADDHHNQSHVLDGGDHTVSGLTAGHALRATGATTFAFGQVSHSDLGGVGTDDHHNQSHAIDGGDHSASGLTTGHVLRASGATTFAFAQLAHTDLGSVGTDDHHNQAHAIDGGDHTAAGLTTGHVLTATGATTFAFQAPSADSPYTEFDATADVSISKGDPVYVSASGEVSPCDNTNDNTRKYVGVAEAAAAADAAVVVQQDGVLDSVTVGGTPAVGDIVWLAATNGLTVTLPTGSGTHRLVIGKMLTTSSLIIQPQYMGKLG
jgi:hypothetical protein